MKDEINAPHFKTKNGKIYYPKFIRTVGELQFWYVYILRCSDNKPYTGYTRNIEDRMSRHNRGSVPATKKRRPLDLLTYISFSNMHQAIAYEKYLKTRTGRAVLYKRFWR